MGASSKTVSTTGKDGAITPDNTNDKRKGALDLSGDYAQSESRRGVVVQAGTGGAQLAAGGDLAMQGGSVKSGGDVALTAAGDMRLDTATSTANALGGSLIAAQATSRNTVNTDKDMSGGKKGAGIQGGTNEKNQGTAINSGGQVVLKSGGATSMTNTESTARRGVVTDAGKGVRTTTVKDRNELLNLGVSSKNSSAGAPLAKGAAKTPATPPAAPSTSPAQPAAAGNAKVQGPASAVAPPDVKAKTPSAWKAGQKAAPKKPAKQAKPIIGETRKAAAKTGPTVSLP